MTAADVALSMWERAGRWAALGHTSRRASKFTHFGAGSVICFPPAALYGEAGIAIGDGTLIGPWCSITAGMLPGQELVSDRILQIGDRCLIGRGSSLVAHLSVEIGDEVFFGPNVYVTDQNHTAADASLPIGAQFEPERPVRIGAGSWLGTNSVVLPGVQIGERCVVGAGAVVTRDLPDGSVAVGNPARLLPPKNLA